MFLPRNYINNSRHLARKYARIFVRGHYLFREANSFPRAKLEENCELRGTDNVQGQISEHIFAPNGDYCLYYPSNLFRNARSLKIGEYLTIILRNRAEYRLILSRRGLRRYSARLSRIIVLLFNKLITKLVTFLNLSVDIFSLHFFFPRTKLRISPDIRYLRMTDIESIMTIFG